MKKHCVALFVALLFFTATVQAEVDCDAQHAKCVDGIPSFAECMNAYDARCHAECDASGNKDCETACDALARAAIKKRSNECAAKIDSLKSSCERKQEICEIQNEEQ